MFCGSWTKVEDFHLVKVIQAQSSSWQTVKEDPPVSTDFRMIANPALHMKHHPSLGGYILLFCGYFSSKTDRATSYCQMKTGKDDESYPKADAFQVYFRSTRWSWDNTQACVWVWPGVCRELLAVAARAGEHLVVPEVPKECTWKDMSIIRKRNIATNLHCEEIVLEWLYLI